MMILVRYLDGTYDMVMGHHLENLINNHEIIGFERSNRWVTIGIDQTRGHGAGAYRGPERRKSSDEESLATMKGE
jgi:hypothetical protein